MGVTVLLRSGKVVRYASANTFYFTNNGHWVQVKQERESKKKNAWPKTISKLIALIPRVEILRAELSGSGQPAPQATKVVKGKERKR
jgi:hypothetical protein